MASFLPELHLLYIRVSIPLTVNCEGNGELILFLCYINTCRPPDEISFRPLLSPKRDRADSFCYIVIL